MERYRLLLFTFPSRTWSKCYLHNSPLLLTFFQAVIVFLIFITCGLQHVVQGMNYKRDLKRVERFMSEARLAAWGPKLVPLDGQRKVRSQVLHYHF